jgi:hypothetical protein
MVKLLSQLSEGININFVAEQAFDHLAAKIRRQLNKVLNFLMTNFMVLDRFQRIGLNSTVDKKSDALVGRVSGKEKITST